MDYDSGREDQPCRKVLKTQGNFSLVNTQPPLTAKLGEMKTILSRLPSSRWVPVIRPVPSLSDVRHACQAKRHMDRKSVNSVSPSRFIDRFCIRRSHVPHVSCLKTMFVYTDGSCYNQRKPGAQGGCTFVINRPDGQVYAATPHRAELRAVVGFLEFRAWMGKGWERIVIVTDSADIANCATLWLPKYARGGWWTRAGRPVADRDLWETLSAKLGEYAKGGCEIAFWVVPQRFNGMADAAAKAAAEEELDRRGILPHY
ncbi:putative rnase h domain protein [Achaetomium macrosporum]|uniref:ribonuclease H n=1 Tax=Achaetomium macrosporum TaxID=79813 RepID=A0AAN7CB35_9PEZI|nr:putative rnase h domain protein [Achaetomium macrosporum]